MVRIALLSAVIFMAGCASTVTPNDALQPPTKIYNLELTKPAANTGTVVVKRDTGFTGGGCNHLLALDAVQVAELRPGEGITIYPAAGDHILSVVGGRGLCGGSTPEIALHIVPGGRLVFRLSVEQSLDVTIRPTAY
jgi:hypothetical protein